MRMCACNDEYGTLMPQYKDREILLSWRLNYSHSNYLAFVETAGTPNAGTADFQHVLRLWSSLPIDLISSFVS